VINDTVARLSAITCVALALAAGAFVYVNSQPGLDGTEVQAEFQDAYPLLEGMHVREYGAVAGTVAEIEVTDDGTVLITMQLNEGTDPPRADATATIRQEDITGDSYVALSPGEDSAELGDDVIPTSRTMSAPRFDDLLNSFNQPVRQGLELTLVELGIALERRGQDLNQAALRLRPAIEATNTVLGEVGSQNDALRALIADAESVTGQAANRSRELGDLVEALSASLQVTAEHSPALDAGLDNLPETLTAARGTLSRLAAATDEATPLARSLEAVAPQLAESARLLAPFLDDTEVVLDQIEPTLKLTAELFRASTPTLRANPKRVFTAPFDVASGTATLLDTLIGDPDLIRGIFGADTYGGTRRGDSSDDVGFGSFPVERGTQANYPADYDPLRRFARASAVPSCENLGIPIAPGCLGEAIATMRDGEGGSGGGGRGSGSAQPAGGAGETGGGQSLAPDVLEQIQGTVDGIVDSLGLPGTDRLPRPGGSGGRAPGDRPLEDLLDFLLTP
jgi:virulence factor Mce-like protein